MSDLSPTVPDAVRGWYRYLPDGCLVPYKTLCGQPIERACSVGWHPRAMTPRYGNARRAQAWGTDKSASTKRWPPSTWSAPATLGTLREEIGSTRAGEYRPVAPVPHRRAQIYASPELSKEDGRHAQSPAHEPAGPPRQTT